MRSVQNSMTFLLVILVGLVLGGILGEVLKNTVPVLASGKSIGFQPVTIDLSVITFTVGLMLQINVASIIGIVLAVIIFNRL